MGKLDGAAGTEIRYIDPLSFKSLKEGDRVQIRGPDGIVIDLKVHGIGEDDTITLGPLSKNVSTMAGFREMKPGQSMVLSHEFRVPDSRALLRSEDTVIVTDKEGRSGTLKTYMSINKDYVVLFRPGAPKPGMTDWLRLGWNIYWK